MNVRRLRLRITALYTFLSAIAVIALGVVGARVGTERIEDGAHQDAERVIGEAIIHSGNGEDSDLGNTWLIGIDAETGDSWNDPLGDVWIEPPIYTIGEQAIDYGASEAGFRQDGVDYLVYGQRFDDNLSVVTAVDLTDYHDRIDSLRLRMALAVVGAIAGIALVGWFVSGRSLAPVRAANARQRDFIADAAHQLRTPLAVIRASASQALAKPREADAYVASLSEIDSAAESAGAAVSELLELARIDSGQFSPRLAPLRLDLLAAEVVAGVRSDGCTLRAEPNVSIVIDGDYALLHHAIENVVRNAAARATEVTVTTRVDGKRAVVAVADNGPGFPDDLLTDVFERFRRGDARGSSGLGLAIARSLVAAHGGSATASNGSAGGAVVELLLPYRPPHRR